MAQVSDGSPTNQEALNLYFQSRAKDNTKNDPEIAKYRKAYLVVDTIRNGSTKQEVLHLRTLSPLEWLQATFGKGRASFKKVVDFCATHPTFTHEKLSTAINQYKQRHHLIKGKDPLLTSEQKVKQHFAMKEFKESLPPEEKGKWEEVMKHSDLNRLPSDDVYRLLDHALKNKDRKGSQTLLEVLGTRQYEKNETAPVSLALQANNKAVARYLLTCGAAVSETERKSDVFQEVLYDSDGNTPLHEACVRGDKQAVEAIIRQDWGVRCLDHNNKSNQSPLIYMISQLSFSEKIGKVLLERSLNMQAAKDGKLYRHILFETKNKELMRVYFSGKRDSELTEWLAEYCETKYADPDVVSWLIRQGVNATYLDRGMSDSILPSQPKRLSLRSALASTSLKRKEVAKAVLDNTEKSVRKLSWLVEMHEAIRRRCVEDVGLLLDIYEGRISEYETIFTTLQSALEGDLSSEDRLKLQEIQRLLKGRSS